MIENVYTCILKDGKRRIILQPFIAYDDNSALTTVRNAIREDEGIRAIAMQERISLHKLCEIVADDDKFIVQSHDVEENIGDNKYFRRFAQLVYGELAVQRANEMEVEDDLEAEVMADPETRESFFHDICENTQIPSDEYMKGELDDD